MKQNEKKRDWLNIEYRRVQNKKLVVTVYVLLRLSVVGMLVAQIFNGNFENVYTCILALILFTIPSLIERRLHICLLYTSHPLRHQHREQIQGGGQIVGNETQVIDAQPQAPVVHQRATGPKYPPELHEEGVILVIHVGV